MRLGDGYLVLTRMQLQMQTAGMRMLRDVDKVAVQAQVEEGQI